MRKTAWVTRTNAAFSVVFSLGLGVAALVLSSQLALAQAADSVLDVGASLLLAWTANIAKSPRDAGHPMGHSRAEALGGLAVAGLSGLLSLEVLGRSVSALMGESQPKLEDILLVLFAIKVVFKAGLFWVAHKGRTPALRAISVDARNDLLVGVVAAAGFLGARAGTPSLDSWLALPLGVWIGWSGFQLAKENVVLLMGAAPPLGREDALRAIARAPSSDFRIGDLRAHYLGHELAVEVEVLVPGDMPVGTAEGYAKAVHQALAAEDDIVHVAVLLRAEGRR